MPANCECHIVAAFPELNNTWEGLGIISATLRTNKAITIVATECSPQIALEGPGRGDLSITAYAPLGSEILECPGNASASFSWDERLECDGFTTHFIPKTTTTAYLEGDVTNRISLTPIGSPYTTFNASAASGPHTAFLKVSHQDGYNLTYSGPPIVLNSSSGKDSMSIGFLNDILPGGSKLYLTSFSWSYTPPNIPTVSYSFLFTM